MGLLYAGNDPCWMRVAMREEGEQHGQTRAVRLLSRD